MAIGVEVGLGPAHVVLDGDPAPLPKKGAQSPEFSAHLYCDETGKRIKVPLGMDVGLSPGAFGLDGDPATSKKGSAAPYFQPSSIVAKWLYVSGYHLIGTSPTNLRHISILTKQLNASKYHLHGGRPQPRRLCVRRGPSPLQKGVAAPYFRPMSIVDKWLYVS